MLILTTSLAIGGILFAAWKDKRNVSLTLSEQHLLINMATPTKTDILKAEATHYQRVSLVALGLCRCYILSTSYVT